MNLNLYQLDAFTKKLFGGNPAAVIPLEQWIDDKLMMDISAENNLSETVFFVPSKNGIKKDKNADFEIRWFTPSVEINLCGHATLASAYYLFEIVGIDKKQISFSSKSGILKVFKEDGMIWLDFPSWKPEVFNDYPENLSELLGGAEIVGVYKQRDLLVELMNEDAVKKCMPDFNGIKETDYKICITAPGKSVDFVSRFFGPSVGIDEDPVTGSAHSQLIPFWSEKLGKSRMSALQLSSRGGDLVCEQKADQLQLKKRNIKSF